jgi:hypothetical protein
MRMARTRQQKMGGDDIRIHWITDDGWLHTHRQSERGYPELEIRDVPGYLAEPTATLLLQVYKYMLESGTRIYPGKSVATSCRTRFRLITATPVAGDEDHYQVERLRVVKAGAACERCGACTCKE